MTLSTTGFTQFFRQQNGGAGTCGESRQDASASGGVGGIVGIAFPIEVVTARHGVWLYWVGKIVRGFAVFTIDKYREFVSEPHLWRGATLRAGRAVAIRFWTSHPGLW